MYGCMDGWMDGRVGGWVDGCRYIDSHVHEFIDGIPSNPLASRHVPDDTS